MLYLNGSMHRSVNCFRLGWPMRAEADFFQQRKTDIEENGVSFLVMHVLTPKHKLN